ncbi:TraB/GumN family protein [Mitsuaria sp. WAJ17]|uniref:TraB/GumN family protein n=1 Tax=Mitsuaria sp. WAJ17 TaxID=2761452 RepID=UPI001601D359|nr:TraB/GumN family protein [Mitsuaria sp. WAJ17]MBB2487341.1 TraB/GumN family protein [Mitsuaria sp. WAJ17]
MKLIRPCLRRCGAVFLFLLMAASAQAQDCPPALPAPNPALLAQPPASAPDRGLLWQLEKDGRSAWLYASIHLGRPEWLIPGRRLQAALAASDTLALELNLGDPQVMQTMAAPVPGRPMLALPAELQSRMQALAQRYCLDLSPYARLHPVLQLGQLVVQSARDEGLGAEFGQEMGLMIQAQLRGLRMAGLETPTLQLQALIPASRQEALEEVREGLRQLESPEVRRQTRLLAEAWDQGDLATLEAYPQWCDCVHTPADRASLKRTIADRNPGMAEGIDRLHAKGQRLLVAVGALHMTGEDSLLVALRARGFRVTQRWPEPR